jgi:hypothetical protein
MYIRNRWIEGKIDRSIDNIYVCRLYLDIDVLQRDHVLRAWQSLRPEEAAVGHTA